MAIYEDVQLKRLVDELSLRERKEIPPPTYRQVQHFSKEIAHDSTVMDARSGLKHLPHERTSAKSFVLSIASPALICQVDEHTLDQLVVAPDGTVLTRRVHGAVLICVKTAAILGAVLSLDALREEDYMRLVKQTLEPKDRLTVLYECKHPWPCSGKPAVIFHDRGKIFTSQRATQVLVDRLGITTEQAPAYAPSAKGTVEALFTWVTRKFSHRLPGTTKSHPTDRGTYDSSGEAEKAGITFDVLGKTLHTSHCRCVHARVGCSATWQERCSLGRKRARERRATLSWSTGRSEAPAHESEESQESCDRTVRDYE